MSASADSSAPITWKFIRRTFTTQERTRDLLSPELERSLAQADFERAVHFLPGSHRYWPNALAIVFSTVAASYGNFRAKPRWPFARQCAIAGLAGFGGASLGLFLNLRAHVSFITSLENQQGFKQALANVSATMDGPTPHEAGVQGEDATPALYPRTSAPSANGSETAASSAVHSRWEDIRVANARKSKRSSSWDALREGHERSADVASADDAPFTADNDRAREQAQFDAMLDAERRKSQN
ncbi:hypothetical protein FIBSPDRAFT_1037698 [Athelia psychrophila]|uniref:Uncharacterized protein n=1 Tax=Athelia psychrophila TaxID=1759441 RepID=A0A166U2M4_9AGAM|nr:hypothetical protein FIBSPDRAFT_1037698 [Fibularhizoctonia sp. CBS 109695]